MFLNLIFISTLFIQIPQPSKLSQEDLFKIIGTKDVIIFQDEEYIKVLQAKIVELTSKDTCK